MRVEMNSEKAQPTWSQETRGGSFEREVDGIVDDAPAEVKLSFPNDVAPMVCSLIASSSSGS